MAVGSYTLIPECNHLLPADVFWELSTLAPAAISLKRRARLLDAPAILGGAKAHPTPFPSWPGLRPVRRTRRARHSTQRQVVSRHRPDGGSVPKAYADLTGAKFCLATANGTSALLTSLSALASSRATKSWCLRTLSSRPINVVLQHRALPVFVDTDAQTFQMDARKIEAAISPRTRAMIPVHLGGSACDLDTILPIAARRGIPVWRMPARHTSQSGADERWAPTDRRAASAFRHPRISTAGEGGAILCNDEDLFERCYRFHNNGTRIEASDSQFLL